MPSSVWLTSSTAQMTRVVAHIVAFSMCTYSVAAFIFLVWPYLELSVGMDYGNEFDICLNLQIFKLS